MKTARTHSSWALISQHLDQEGTRTATSFFKQLISLSDPELALLGGLYLKWSFEAPQLKGLPPSLTPTPHPWERQRNVYPAA